MDQNEQGAAATYAAVTKRVDDKNEDKAWQGVVPACATVARKVLVNDKIDRSTCVNSDDETEEKLVPEEDYSEEADSEGSHLA